MVIAPACRSKNPPGRRPGSRKDQDVGPTDVEGQHPSRAARGLRSEASAWRFAPTDPRRPPNLDTVLALALLALSPISTLDDTCATAELAGPATPGTAIFLPRVIAAGETTDHFRFQVAPGLMTRTRALVDPGNQDLQIRLWNADCSVLLAGPITGASFQSLDWLNLGSTTEDLVAELFVNSPLATDVDYTLRVDAVVQDCDFDDALEPNQSCAGASPITFSGTLASGFTLSAADEDRYSLSLPPTSTLRLTVRSSTGDGDTNAELWASDCITLLDAESAPGYDDLEYTNVTNSPQTVALRVFRSDTQSNCCTYSIQRLDRVGVTECFSVPNSTGLTSTMVGYGSTSVFQNNLTLYAQGTTMDQYGLCVYGPDPAPMPLGNGVLCVDPSGLVRGSVVQGLYMSIAFDLDSFGGTSPFSPFNAGDTYRFQAWFRDPSDPVGFGLSDALRITFTP